MGKAIGPGSADTRKIKTSLYSRALTPEEPSHLGLLCTSRQWASLLPRLAAGRPEVTEGRQRVWASSSPKSTLAVTGLRNPFCGPDGQRVTKANALFRGKGSSGGLNALLAFSTTITSLDFAGLTFQARDADRFRKIKSTTKTVRNGSGVKPGSLTRL
jgi:hypothetical protein